ncbi:hypothetical protein DW904_19370 [Ruminococcus sp. AM42-11]|nr:hypothetical protein DW904_19370 [Ruminococcus sp. AM42-11]
MCVNASCIMEKCIVKMWSASYIDLEKYAKIRHIPYENTHNDAYYGIMKTRNNIAVWTIYVLPL